MYFALSTFPLTAGANRNDPSTLDDRVRRDFAVVFRCGGWLRLGPGVGHLLSESQQLRQRLRDRVRRTGRICPTEPDRALLHNVIRAVLLA